LCESINMVCQLGSVLGGESYAFAPPEGPFSEGSEVHQVFVQEPTSSLVIWSKH